MPTARAIVQAIQNQQDEGSNFDILLFGNDSADSGGYQVGIRVAHALDLPCVTGIKALKLENGKAQAQRETDGGWEIYEVALPAVFTVKEGINLPRYPSLPGKLRAKKKPVEHIEPLKSEDGLRKVILKLPAEQDSEVEILGTGAGSVPKIIEILDGLELI
jgi:electron transfer flavoprotein beta subunit